MLGVLLCLAPGMNSGVRYRLCLTALFLWKCEGNVCSSWFQTVPRASRCYRNVLLSLHHVGNGCGKASGRKLIFPYNFSCFGIKSPYFFIISGGDKKQSASRNNRSSMVLCTGRRNSLFRKLR